ncbi:MAG: serine/threonine protein kinase [Synechococcaceae cyanobacterium SM2_3_1]|nr:serine/threonine protein kinase [Synechococcaceae cyanobacterium SM2_3_1]
MSNHPNITKVLDYGLADERPYLVMEYLGEPPLSGSDLEQMLARRGVLSPRRMLRLALQMCAGLHFAHTFERDIDDLQIRGVIHRDIKPSNFFLLQDTTLGEEGEVVKIMDFGLAKIVSDIAVTLGTKAVRILGTLPYTSPEQLLGEDLDPRSDIYSLGMVMYEMLTGKSPLRPRSRSHTDWIEAHLYLTPVEMRQRQLLYPVPASLQALVMSCLEKDRQKTTDQHAGVRTATQRDQEHPFRPAHRSVPFPERAFSLLTPRTFLSIYTRYLRLHAAFFPAPATDPGQHFLPHSPRSDSETLHPPTLWLCLPHEPGDRCCSSCHRIRTLHHFQCSL